MKVLFLLSPRFREWPRAMAHEIGALEPGSTFPALVVGSKRIVRRVAEWADPGFAPLYDVDELEREWLATPSDPGRLREFERRLAPGALMRILASDRAVGAGFVSGARLVSSRLLRGARSSPVEVPRRYLQGLLDFTWRTLEEHRPEVVFCYTVAGAHAMALAEVCGAMEIPFATLAPTRIGAQFVIDERGDGSLAPVRRAFQRALADPDAVPASLPRARSYVQTFRSRPQPPDHAVKISAGMAQATSAQRLATRLASLGAGLVRRPLEPVRGGRADMEVVAIPALLRARRLARGGPYRPLSELTSGRYVYFPLHVDPEASTMVLAPMHTDQVAVIEALAKSLPAGMHLVVKEHHPMLGLRPAGFYERIGGMPGVMLASPLEDGFGLLRGAAIVATITGSAGWEALLLRIPTVVIGRPPYVTMGEGFVHCPDLSALPSALPSALNMPPASDERLELYVAALLDRSFEFPHELYWGEVTEATVRENPRILQALVEGIMARAGRRPTPDAAGAGGGLPGEERT